MCGFCGYTVKRKNNTNTKKDIITKMNKSLTYRGPNQCDYYIDENIALGHCRLSIIDLKTGNQPMKKIHNNKEYVIVYNGELYNTEEIKEDLISKGYTFNTTSDTEVVLTAFIEYSCTCLEYLNGIFAFVIYEKTSNMLFLARDRLGIKPLFYTIYQNNIIFASEIKAILKYPDIKAVLTKEGLLEIMALGPAHSPGKTCFKDILEIKPGHYGIFKDNILTTHKYWDLETKENFDTEAEAIDNIHYLVTDATKKQLVSDVKICSMLSGGIDSSILAKIAKDNIPDLTTFSIDYVNNDKDFTASIYQSSKDSDYVKIMVDFLKTDHKYTYISHETLFELLHKSMIARDMPGMADIDSSMYAFCNQISNTGFKVCLSGECSDEIFGGYPWYYRKHLIEHTGFPWALSENLRQDLVKSEILSTNSIKEYVDSAIKDTLKNVTHPNTSDKFEHRFKDINYLTIKWFMNTLIERTDRISMANSLEVRVPFADYRIFEYVYNLPAKMKLGLTNSSTPIEKYLLRKAFENELPKEIIYRKKSPFPKTYNPKYLALVEQKTQEIIQNKNSKIHHFINTDYLQTLINTHGKTLTENLFGQLMTYPQTLAYIIQIEDFLNTYEIELDF